MTGGYACDPEFYLEERKMLALGKLTKKALQMGSLPLHTWRCFHLGLCVSKKVRHSLQKSPVFYTTIQKLVSVRFVFDKSV